MSKIEWTDETWNPVTGCTKISPGCKNCYAERMAHRLQAMGQMNYKNGFKVTLHPETLEKPLHWKNPKMIFVNSMSDLFHDDVPSAFITKVFEVMEQCPQHIFQILTKRPERMLAWHNTERFFEKPLRNVWLGVSIENQDAAIRRIPFLQQSPAIIRFISYEPALGPLELHNVSLMDFSTCGTMSLLAKIDWIIAGCESGSKRRSADVNWFRIVRDQCQRAGIPFFLKQMEIDGKIQKRPILDGSIYLQWPATCRLEKQFLGDSKP